MKKIIMIAVLAAVIVGSIGYLQYAGSDTTKNIGQQNEASPEPNRSAQDDGSAINLSGKGLTSVSKDLLDNSSVTTLDVSKNQLTGALPAEIRRLSNLEVLNASDNNFTGIPAEIGQLRRLKIANFANNNISGLPLEIGNLKNLETLDLRGNPSVSARDVGLLRQKMPSAKILTD